MNKRQHERHSIEHLATLVLEDGIKVDCRIENFSFGGLFIMPVDKNWLVRTGDRAMPRTTVAIQVQTPRGSKGSSIIVQARVIHISSTGLGLKFLNPENELLDYLYRLAKGSGKIGTHTERRPTLGAKETSIVNWVHAYARKYIEARYPKFIQSSYEDLAEAADKATSDKEQRLLYDTQTSLKRDESRIRNAYLSNINSSFSGFKRGTPVSNGMEKQDPQHENLELVEKEDFEEWVSVVSLTRNLDQHIASRLHKLENGLSYLSKSYISNESNPISPYSLLWAFKKALSETGIKIAPKRILYSSFSKSVFDDIATLYENVNKYLSKHGIHLEEQTKPTPKPRSAVGTRSRRGKKLGDTLSSLMGLMDRGPKSSTDAPSETGAASREMVTNTLRNITTTGKRPIIQRIEESLVGEVVDGRPATVDRQTRDAIQVSENLLNSLQQDFSISPEVQELITGLKLPFVKETINDPNFLNNPGHPGHKLLETIGRLSPYLQSTEESRAEKGHLLQALEEINRLTEQGVDLDIHEVTGHLEHLVDYQKEQFQQNLDLVTQGCEQDEHYSDTETQVTELLCSKLADKSIPMLIQELLHLGWPAVLINTLSSTDPESEESAHISGVLDQLLEIFSSRDGLTKYGSEEIKQMMSSVSKGLKSYPLHDEATFEFINMLHEFFDSEGELNPELQSERVTLDEASIKRLIVKQSSTLAPVELNVNVEQTWIDLVSGIKLDDWIVEQRKQGHVRMLNLAWMNQHATRYVFVDGEGRKSLDAEKLQLAQMFKQQECSLLEDGNIPIVERTVNKLLKNTFDQIKHESDTDELTGLLGRKGFQRKLTELLDMTTDPIDNHVMLELDIDKFSVINDLCGFKGGDKLLETVANILRNYQPENSLLARIGDDEFGLLIKNCSLDEAYRIAETQRRALENLRYTWDGTAVPASASVGMAPINSETGNANQILNQASDACKSAMDEGGNCTRIYKPSTQDIEKRKKLAQTVPLIEDALNNDKLGLFAQPIAPVFLGDGEDHHYEILLRVKGDDGNWQSPVEFIQAAEQYNRMRSVDRWVINSMFNWLENHHQELNGTGFSINLSAQTLDDESFSMFMSDHLEKTSFPTERLTLEITETSLVQHIDKAKKLIEGIKNKGVKFSLDDFGTGYSSYSYLKDFPVDYVKIDGVFIKDILTESSSYAMVKSITEISHHMEKKVVAEYVENEAILVALRELEVDFAQGYGVGHPVPLKNILQETFN